MLFEIAAEVRQIGKAAKLSSLTNGERLVREKVFRLIEAHLYQIIMRCAAEKLFIIGIKLAFSILALSQSFSMVHSFS